MSETAKEERKLPILLPERIGLAEFKRQDWVAQVGLDVTEKDILEPAFWAHVCQLFKKLDTIEVRWEDGSLIHHLRVLWCDRAYANVKLIGTEKLGKIVPDKDMMSNKYSTDWKGDMEWCVTRIADHRVMQTNLRDRASVASWIADHERQQ